MISFLINLPDIQLFVVIMASSLLLTTIIPYFIRFKFKLNPSEDMAKGADDAFRLVCSMALVVCVFSLLRVQGDHRNAEDFVTKEASLIHKLDGAYSSFGGPEAEELRGDLISYVKSVAKDEWPLLEVGKESETTANLVADLTQGSRLLIPKNAIQQMARVEINVSLNQLVDVRHARLTAGKIHLPEFLVLAIVLIVGLLVVLGWFLNPIKRMLFFVGGTTLGFALLCTLLIQFGEVYIGYNKVTPDEILKAINL